MRRILCYGDSNTWGYTPGSGARYAEDVRWTGVLAGLLGADYRIIEEGLNARTTIYDDPFKPFLNGRDILPAILTSQKPLDLVVLSLGTNDLKFVDAWHAAQGMGQLINRTLHADTFYPGSTPIFRDQPRVIVVSPIEVAEEIAHRDTYDTLMNGHAQSTLFPREFGAVCRQWGVTMVDASRLAKPSPVDGVHMTAEGHRALAEALADAIRNEWED